MKWIKAIFGIGKEPERIFSKNLTEGENPQAFNSEVSKSRISIEYADKIRSLLTVKGRAEEFESLCGWDEEYGKATAYVFSYAELSNENPVVVASFILDSLEQYHQNRDEALTYLARLANGLKARLENPELAAQLDAEQAENDRSDILFKSINIASNSPEASYIREVDKFILSTGHYESLVLPAQDDDEFMEASINVYMAGYQTDSSPKIVGMLIAEGANKFKHNSEFGIIFLDKVASNMRKRHSEATEGDTSNGNEKTDPANSSIQMDDIERKAERYHKQIDDQIELSYKFLQDNFGAEETESTYEPFSLKTLAVFTVHLSSLVGIKREFPETHRMTLNGFTRTLSFRTPNTMPNANPPNDRFVSYCSLEESFMHNQTETYQQVGLKPLVQYLLRYLGSGKDSDYTLLCDHVERTSHQICKTYLPHLVDE